MKNSQGGFANIILVILIVAVAGVIGYFALVKKQEVPTTAQQSTTPPEKTTGTQTPISGKLPKITLTRFSSTAAGGSGISVTPTSFTNNISQQNLPESSDVYSYKTLFSSAYVAELAKTFGVPLLTPKPCPPEVDCGNERIENGVYKSQDQYETKYEISYNYDSKTGKYPVYRQLGMASGGDANFEFEVKQDSPLYAVPEITNPDQAIQQVKTWLARYSQVFEDLDNWSGEYDRVAVTFSPTQPKPLYRAPYIRVNTISDINSSTGEKEVVAVVTWLSSHNKQISNYKLRSIDDAWKDLSSGGLRGYYDQIVILGVPFSAVNSDYLTKHNGAITGIFTANEVSLAHGRWDDPYYASPGFFLAPVYVFSGLLDTGVQKLPLKIWVPAVPYDKG